LPTGAKSAKAAKKVAEQFGLGANAPDPVLLNDIAGTVIEMLRARRVPERRIWKKAPWCIWATSPAIADDQLAFRNFLAFAKDSTISPRSFIRALAIAYLRDFVPDRPHIAELTQIVLGRIRDVPEPISKILGQIESREPLLAPKLFAVRVLESKQSVYQALRAMGVGAPIARGGFATAIGMEILQALLKRLSSQPTASDVDAIFKAIEGPEGEDALPTLAVPAIRTMISPFSQKPPGQKIRERIVDVALTRLGDPRLQPHRWAQNAAEAAILARWMDEESLRQFLDVVDETAFRDHWNYRRKFWEAWWQQGRIDQAWVAFGPNAHRRAKRVLGEKVAFARVERGGPGSDYLYDNHSVLLLRIGDLTVADWSHSSKCYVWEPGNRKAPEFYRPRYSAGALRDGSDFSQSHHSPATYSWQRDVNDFIRRQTGMSLKPKDYEVK
jgi:hypothetical protein